MFRWLVVVGVGVLLVILVFALSLFSRLGAGQDVLDDLRPVNTDERVMGARAGIDQISTEVDLVDPLATFRGTGAGEAKRLVGLVSRQSGVPRARVAAILRREAPHTEALLRALPLSRVSKELPGLVRFLARSLERSPRQVQATLKKRFPRLAQAVAALPLLTDGWNDVPGTRNLTRFDGKRVRTVPQVRDYFSGDVIPVLEDQHENFQELDGRGGVGYIPALLLVLGLIVIVFGLVQATRARRGPTGPGSWAVVLVVGVGLIVFVFLARLFPRLNGGDELIDRARPAFTDERVAGGRAGIGILSTFVDAADPIVLRSGGGAAEVPKLIRFVSRRTDLSRAQVRSELRRRAPHTAALLEAIPLKAVADEVPHLAAVLSRTLGIRGDQLIRRLRKRAPGLAQSILSVRDATAGWQNVPGTGKMTRFDGRPARSVPAVRDYFSKDAIPAVERQRENFQELDETWPPVNVFPPLLLVLGLLVAVYGLVNMRVAPRAEPSGRGG